MWSNVQYLNFATILKNNLSRGKDYVIIIQRMNGVIEGTSNTKGTIFINIWLSVTLTTGFTFSKWDLIFFRGQFFSKLLPRSAIIVEQQSFEN